MVKAIPEGFHSLAPHLTVDGAAQAIEFYKKAFGAVEKGRMPMPDGKKLMHAELRMGNVVVFLVDDFPEYHGGKAQSPTALGGTPVTLHRYVENCDAAIKRAVDAGAKVLMPVQDMFWGDRYGTLTDPFGHSWAIATHKKDMTPAEIAEAGKKAMAAMAKGKKSAGEERRKKN